MVKKVESLEEVVSVADAADSASVMPVCGEAVARVRQMNRAPAPRDNARHNSRRHCFSPHSVFVSRQRRASRFVSAGAVGETRNERTPVRHTFAG